MSQNPLIYGSPPLNNLAVACLFILVGWAYVEFPDTSRSGPSRSVYVFRQRHLPSLDGIEGLFPIWMDGDQWERAVVPVLQDETWQRSKPLIKSRLRNQDFTTLVCRLEGALIESHREAGFIL